MSLSFLVSDALAQGAPAPQEPNPILSLLPLIILFVLFYFLLIRPQQKRQKEHRKMVEALSKGDEVVTTGGLLGRITDLDESFIRLKIAEGIEVKVQRHAINQLLPKGTMKE
jgi:preprotein translocase subunit YajC